MDFKKRIMFSMKSGAVYKSQPCVNQRCPYSAVSLIVVMINQIELKAIKIVFFLFTVPNLFGPVAVHCCTQNKNVFQLRNKYEHPKHKQQIFLFVLKKAKIF